MSVDTSSSAAASTLVVWVAASAPAALSADSIPAKSAAAAVIISGAAITNDIPHLHANQDDAQPLAGESVTHRSYAEFTQHRTPKSRSTAEERSRCHVNR